MVVVLGRRPGPDDVEGLLCDGGWQDLWSSRRRRVFLDIVENIMKAKEKAERE